MRLLVISLLSAVIVTGCQIPPLNLVYEWKYVDFVWEPQKRQNAINSGYYDPVACSLFDVDKTKDGRTFVTLVRVAGVPACLATVTDKIGEGGPLLRPYPDWSWHDLTKPCSKRMTNVYRVDIKCNYLFALDSGKIDDEELCPPQLLIFNLITNKLVTNIPIPEKVATNENGAGLLVTPIVEGLCYDVNGICHLETNTVTVYMADTEGNGLVVYHKNKFCRFESDSMKPTNPNFTIDNESFFLEDGILGMTHNSEYLYYSPLAGNTIYKIKKSDLIKKCALSVDKTIELTINEVTELISKLNQTGPMASKDRTLFFSDIPNTSILCTDVDYPSNVDVIAHDSIMLQFTSGMKVRSQSEKVRRVRSQSEKVRSQSEKVNSKLWLLSNRFQKMMNNNRSGGEINYRIFNFNIKLAELSGCNCFKFGTIIVVVVVVMRIILIVVMMMIIVTIVMIRIILVIVVMIIIVAIVLVVIIVVIVMMIVVVILMVINVGSK